MANPFTQKARQRKFIYTALILVLFTGSLMHRRLVVEPEAQRLKLREVVKKEVELTSSAVRLMLTGSRGLAVTFLWATAIDQQERHEWNELELLVGAITKLQPYHITPWLYQGWNLAYNVAVECDMPRDKFYYVSRGLHLLAEGERRNEEQGIGQPDLRHFIGVAYQGKIGISDEKNAMRCLLDLSCIDPVRRDPGRFWADRGRRTVNLAELAKLCREQPRLVRRLRAPRPYGLECTEPKQIVDYLEANREVPSRFQAPLPGVEQKETPLKDDYREQFPTLPPPQAGYTPNPAARDYGLGNESFDVFAVSRAWHQYAQEPLPPPVRDASHDESPATFDRLKYRLPKAPALPIFRSYPPRARAYSAETLNDEGWFDEDGWVIRNWFDSEPGLGQEEFRVGTEIKYHAGPAWDRAHRAYKEYGTKIGLYYSEEELRELDRQAEKFRKATGISANEAGAQTLPGKYRNDDEMRGSWNAHQKLYWRKAISHLTNFGGHLSATDAERSAESVLARKLFFHAERQRRFEVDPEQSLALYEQAWPIWLGVLARHPRFAEQSTNQEDMYEFQLKHLLRLLQNQRATQIKAVTMGVAQIGIWPPAPLDDLVSSADKTRILPIRTATGPLDWARIYDGPQRDELGRFLLGWSQATHPARLFLFPGQEDWTLLALAHRSDPMHPGWILAVSDEAARNVKTRLGIVKPAPDPEPTTPAGSPPGK
jgi:hypothetical protein